MEFAKYHGAGNDFILIDDRAGMFLLGNIELVKHLCDRHFGIGADGLLLLQESLSPAMAYKMVYYNSDGNVATFCGNGGRCLAAFAANLGVIEPKDWITFEASDGPHKARYTSPDTIELQMRASGPPIQVEIEGYSEAWFMNTGSPHLLIPVPDVHSIDVRTLGAKYRYDPQFAVYGGVNVNFIETVGPTSIKVRTYERGVEDETLSCGTGVTASALWHAPGQLVHVDTPGGKLQVASIADLSEIFLIGPAEEVFKGVYPIHG
jgi:diaminopimelate epimerase